MSTLVYDFTSADTGEVDQETGALRYSPDGYHLLSRLTLQALGTGGEVYAVRPEEISSSTWIAPAVAGFALHAGLTTRRRRHLKGAAAVFDVRRDQPAGMAAMTSITRTWALVPASVSAG